MLLNSWQESHIWIESVRYSVEEYSRQLIKYKESGFPVVTEAIIKQLLKSV